MGFARCVYTALTRSGDDARGCQGIGAFALVGDDAVGAALRVVEAFVSVHGASGASCSARSDPQNMAHSVGSGAWVGRKQCGGTLPERVALALA